MSRCYPFPPPGYAGKYSSREALVLSIKLQKEKERAISDNGAEKLIPEKLKSSEKRKEREHRKEKKDKKDRKKEKKEKGEKRKQEKEKKQEKKAKPSVLVDNGKHGDVGKLPEAGDVGFESKGKIQGSFAELLERSIVTEEHGQPVESQNTSCSSDSTGNSGKRKRFAASPSAIQSIGNVIRIRLSSSQTRDEPSTSGSKEREVGPVSVKLKDVIPSGLEFPHTASISTATLQLVAKVDDASHLKEKTSGNIPLKEKLSSRDKKMQRKECLLKKLFVDWVVPPLERTLEVEDADDEWLFGKKGEDGSAKRLRVGEECESLRGSNSCSASAVMQPRAQLLADAAIYALPFTVPF